MTSFHIVIFLNEPHFYEYYKTKELVLQWKMYHVKFIGLMPLEKNEQHSG